MFTHMLWPPHALVASDVIVTSTLSDPYIKIEDVSLLAIMRFALCWRGCKDPVLYPLNTHRFKPDGLNLV